MKFKHKEFVLGIILGGVIFSNLTIFANEALNVFFNPFKITVDGVYKNIEGYNINGSTYFKLRDIGNEVGFKVDFKEETIMINTDENVVTNISSQDILYNYITIDGIEYIASIDVDSVVCKYFPKWVFAYTGNENSAWTRDGVSYCYLNEMDNNYESIAEYKITCTFINGKPYLSREVFENEILGRIEKE